MVDVKETDAVSVSPDVEELPAPAYRIRKGAAFFRIGVGLFVALSGLLAMVSCSSASSSVNWESGAKVLGEEALFDLVLSNVSDKTPVATVHNMIEQVDVSLLGRNKEQDLWLLRFNADEVCGRLGCLHTIVTRDSDKTISGQIWSQYFHSDIPTGSALGIVPAPNGAVEPSDFACLQISQVVNDALRRTTQCYESGSYRVVAEEQSLL